MQETKEEIDPQKIIDEKLAEHKQLAENVANAKVPVNGMDKAWSVYQQMLGQLTHLLKNYDGSKKCLLRLLYMSAVHPFQLEEFHHSYPRDEEIYKLLCMMQDAKILLLELAFKEKNVAEQIKKENKEKELKNENV